MKFNPKVKDFLENNKNVTVIGLYFAGLWRFLLFFYGGILLIMIFLLGLEVLFS